MIENCNKENLTIKLILPRNENFVNIRHIPSITVLTFNKLNAFHKLFPRKRDLIFSLKRKYNNKIHFVNILSTIHTHVLILNHFTRRLLAID